MEAPEEAASADRSIDFTALLHLSGEAASFDVPIYLFAVPPMNMSASCWSEERHLLSLLPKALVA